MTEQMPSFLQKRVAQAKAKAATAAASVAANQAKPNALTTQPAPPPRIQPAKPAATSVAKTSRKGVKSPEREKCEPVHVAESGSGPDIPFVGPDVMAALREMATGEPAAVEGLIHHLPDVLAAVVEGAKVAGIKGNADRMTFFRILGLPFTPAAGSGRLGGDGAMSSGAADRMTAALNRVERRLSGHVPVTLDVVPEADASDQALIEG